jgi:hypothetical protein
VYIIYITTITGITDINGGKNIIDITALRHNGHHNQDIKINDTIDITVFQATVNIISITDAYRHHGQSQTSEATLT